jgi:hypothetical protein
VDDDRSGVHCLVSPAAVQAHEGHLHNALGTVSSIDGQHVVVKTTDGKSVTVMLDKETAITRGKEKLDATALTTLSVYKPWGMTPYGIRQQVVETEGLLSVGRRQARPAGLYVLITIAAFVGIILVLHLFGVGLHGH